MSDILLHLVHLLVSSVVISLTLIDQERYFIRDDRNSFLLLETYESCDSGCESEEK